MQHDLTKGSIPKNLLTFSVPYLIACFLQTFYGLADLFITGQFNGAASISAVSVGSQVMHMLTVILMGLAMGSTVLIGRNIGAKDRESASKSVGTSITLFLLFSLVLTAVLLIACGGIIHLLDVPEEAVSQTRQYLTICFIGIPFITAYNVLSSIFRGLGDTRSPMIFVFIAGVLNVALDTLFIGPLHMAAAGAALATTLSQSVSVVIAFFALQRMNTGIHLTRQSLRPERETLRQILSVGIPVACQDGFIQVSFMIITIIANSRGVSVSAAVGIVEKIISFLFLVPSAMQASVTALGAQCIGAGAHGRVRATLRWALYLCCGYALIVIVLVELFTAPLISLFVQKDPVVVTLGVQYLRTYVLDTFMAGDRKSVV